MEERQNKYQSIATEPIIFNSSRTLRWKALQNKEQEQVE